MNNILKYEEFNQINEGKASDIETFGNYITYHKEVFPNVNYPKRYIGKGKFKYRVLSREGDKVKPINFGDKTQQVKLYNRLNKKYWENLPNFK